MEKSLIYSRIKIIIKSLFLVLFTGIIILLIFIIFFLNKDRRFVIAENLQGTQLSQFMFKVLTKQYPDYSDAYHEQSVAYNKRGLYYDGFKLLDKAVLLNPKRHLGYRGWMKLEKLKDYKGAIIDLERFDTLTPNIVDDVQGENINYLLAISYQGLGKYDKSREYYEKYFQTADSTTLSINSIVHVNYGTLLEKLNLYNEALQQLDKSLKTKGFKFSEAYFHKAEVFEKLGKKDSARYYYKEALHQYDKSSKLKDVYNEVFNELYRQDITIKINNT
ncbi:tetratricopeptide repeat protein [Chryseobacterium sp. RP-3-3]|uniref:Tetratricopeptide repeat protein n=1 Tax=Chryseobacterium antibioticum TaxID=2728847 RepID=A0A7Y0FST1_9FLAO|nr:tetratricopeptide repeat protein [Chryseobacterium antibioticum]NML70754.1 tetratricopeptide repeat protein [Chryseobacterium antibioticum]